jgi:hypothetical protein
MFAGSVFVSLKTTLQLKASVSTLVSPILHPSTADMRFEPAAMARSYLVLVIALMAAVIVTAQPEASASTFGWGRGHGGFVPRPPVSFQCQPLPTLSGNSKLPPLYAPWQWPALGDHVLVPALLLLVTLNFTWTAARTLFRSATEPQRDVH